MYLVRCVSWRQLPARPENKLYKLAVTRVILRDSIVVDISDLRGQI